MKNLFHYILLGLIWVMTNRPATGEESAANLASRFAVLPLEEQIHSNLPKGRENEVIKSFIEANFVEVLMRINHVPTIEETMKIYYETEGKSIVVRSIANSGSPFLVERLAPCLYKEDQSYVRGRGELGPDFGESCSTALLIGKLLMESPEFSDDVKKWAKRNLSAHGTLTIAIGRQFWELNQETLKAQQFDKVIAPQGSPSLPPLSPQASSSIPVTAPVLPSNQPPQLAVESSAPQTTSPTKYWWSVGIFFALIGVVIFIKKKT